MANNNNEMMSVKFTGDGLKMMFRRLTNRNDRDREPSPESSGEWLGC